MATCRVDAGLCRVRAVTLHAPHHAYLCAKVALGRAFMKGMYSCITQHIRAYTYAHGVKWNNPTYPTSLHTHDGDPKRRSGGRTVRIGDFSGALGGLWL
jgi:hypothetical protein